MTTTNNRLAAKNDMDLSAWWLQPYCWLVITGPLVVVIAAIATMFIAYRNADPVVQEYLSSQTAHQGTGYARSMQPAETLSHDLLSPAGKPAR